MNSYDFMSSTNNTDSNSNSCLMYKKCTDLYLINTIYI